MSGIKPKKPSVQKKAPSSYRIAKENHSSISERIDGCISDAKITQSCATPPRPNKMGNNDNNSGEL